jgi:hypothetical protein
MTLSIIAFITMTLNIMTPNMIITLSIMRNSKTVFSIMTLSIMTLNLKILKSYS